MKNVSFRGLLFLLCVLLLFSSGALAADTSAANCERSKLSHCNITTLQSNQYTAGRPVVIFFPGSKECNSYENVIRFIRNYHLYDDMETDLIAVTLRGSGAWYRNWEAAGVDLYEFLKDKYDASPFPVIVDAVSFGGYGGCWLTEYFRENGIPVEELNLADACGSYCISVDWVRDLALAGTRVNLWGCTGTSSISRDTRSCIEQLEGTANLTGTVIECSHGQVLNRAIYEYGLHAAYRTQKEEADD